MPNVKLMPPGGKNVIITINGRTYDGSAGTALTVPDFDANIMTANGWIVVGSKGVDVTANRPANPQADDTFYDTTLSLLIQFDGSVWRNPDNGNAV